MAEVFLGPTRPPIGGARRSPVKRTIALLLGTLTLGACAAETASDVGGAAAELVQLQGASCVALLAGQTIPAGTVCSTVEGDDLVVEYRTADGWELTEAHLWSGLSLGDLPQTRSGNPQIGLFPYHSGAIAGATSQVFRIPLARFGLDADQTVCDPVTAFVVAHAAVRKPLAKGGYRSESAFGEGTRLVNRGSWATWFSLVLTCTDDAPETGTCGAAWALFGGLAACFPDSELVETDRSGWTNGPIPVGYHLATLYANPDGCWSVDTKAGVMETTYDGTSLRLVLKTIGDYSFAETNVYVGSEPFPRDENGEYTVAPGHFPLQHVLTSETEDVYEITGLPGGDLYVIAHTVICE